MQKVIFYLALCFMAAIIALHGHPSQAASAAVVPQTVVSGDCKDDVQCIDSHNLLTGQMTAVIMPSGTDVCRGVRMQRYSSTQSEFLIPYNNPSEWGDFISHAPTGAELHACCLAESPTIPGLTANQSLGLSVSDSSASQSITFSDAYGSMTIVYKCLEDNLSPSQLSNGTDDSYGYWASTVDINKPSWETMVDFGACQATCPSTIGIQTRTIGCFESSADGQRSQVDDSICTAAVGVKPATAQSCSVTCACNCAAGLTFNGSECTEVLTAALSYQAVISTVHDVSYNCGVPFTAGSGYNAATDSWNAGISCWNVFMMQHAIWPFDASSGTSSAYGNIPFTFSASFTAPVAGNYTFAGASDNSGSFQIDSGGNYNISAFNATTYGTIYGVTAGLHNVTMTITNADDGQPTWAGNPAGIALEIFDPNQNMVFQTSSSLPPAYVNPSCPAGYSIVGSVCQESVAQACNWTFGVQPSSCSSTDDSGCSWYGVAGAYGACSNSCGSGTQTASYWTCSSTNNLYIDESSSLCSAPTRACTDESGCGWTGVASAWSSCSNSCGTGTQTATNWTCNSNNGAFTGASYSLCSAPTQACSSEAGCGWVGVATAYGSCSNSCGSGTATATSWTCSSSNGLYTGQSSSLCAAPTEACSSEAGCSWVGVATAYGACSTTCGAGTETASAWTCSSSNGVYTGQAKTLCSAPTKSCSSTAGARYVCGACNGSGQKTCSDANNCGGAPYVTSCTLVGPFVATSCTPQCCGSDCETCGSNTVENGVYCPSTWVNDAPGVATFNCYVLTADSDGPTASACYTWQ